VAVFILEGWSGWDLPAGFWAGDLSASGWFECAEGAQASLEDCFIRLADSGHGGTSMKLCVSMCRSLRAVKAWSLSRLWKYQVQVWCASSPLCIRGLKTRIPLSVYCLGPLYKTYSFEQRSPAISLKRSIPFRKSGKGISKPLFGKRSTGWAF